MAVTASAVSRVTGVGVQYKNFNSGAAAMLPQRLVVIGVGNTGVTYDATKFEATGTAEEIGERYGYGSPLHLVARQLFPMTGKGATFPVTFIPLAETAGSTAASGEIGCTGTASAAGSGVVKIGGITADFTVANGADSAVVLATVKEAIARVIDMPVTAGTVADGKLPVTSKAKGTVGNLIKVAVVANIPGLTFSTKNLTGGASDPDVDEALTKVAEVWETAVLNTFPYNDNSRLEKFMIWGKGRWDDLTKKPVLCYHGCTDDYRTRTAVTDARPTDWINALIVSVGSPELPYCIAAKAMVNDILTTADSNPALGYKGLLEGLESGIDQVQEDYLVRNNSVNKGSSTNIKNGSVAELNDIVTMYHPASEGKFPSRRYVVDLIKLMNVVYNVRLIMEADDKKGAPIVGDNEITSNRAAIQPKTIKSEFVALAYSLTDRAIIRDTEFTVKNIEVAEDKENPKRINVTFPVKVSGNLEVASTDIVYGFYLGGN